MICHHQVPSPLPSLRSHLLPPLPFFRSRLPLPLPSPRIGLPPPRSVLPQGATSPTHPSSISNITQPSQSSESAGACLCVCVCVLCLCMLCTCCECVCVCVCNLLYGVNQYLSYSFFTCQLHCLEGWNVTEGGSDTEIKYMSPSSP